MKSQVQRALGAGGGRRPASQPDRPQPRSHRLGFPVGGAGSARAGATRPLGTSQHVRTLGGGVKPSVGPASGGKRRSCRNSWRDDASRRGDASVTVWPRLPADSAWRRVRSALRLGGCAVPALGAHTHPVRVPGELPHAAGRHSALGGTSCSEMYFAWINEYGLFPYD